MITAHCCTVTVPAKWQSSSGSATEVFLQLKWLLLGHPLWVGTAASTLETAHHSCAINLNNVPNQQWHVSFGAVHMAGAFDACTATHAHTGTHATHTHTHTF
eukprot:m.399142 g.399142  ORF g.399142 m.399142 type:complete len:102 (+) comp28378_c2_seq1:350-655(+)